MKVIVNFGEQKVVVPCGNDGDLSIRDLILLAAAKYSKLVRSSPIHSDQVQLRLNNGAVLDPDDRVGDVLDDREEVRQTGERENESRCPFVTVIRYCSCAFNTNPRRFILEFDQFESFHQFIRSRANDSSIDSSS